MINVKFVLFLVLFREIVSLKSCKNYLDYYLTFGNKNCFEDKENFANATTILHYYNIPYETFELTTEDGYILTLFHLPTKNPKGVALLLHPLTSDPVYWLGQRNDSLAFHFLNRNYDVWIPANRATTYSTKHVNLTTHQFKYWDFSYHEVGIYDYKKIFKFVYEQTRTPIIAVGHSMAGTSSLVYAALNPQEAQKMVKVFIMICAAISFTDMRTPTKYLAPLKPIAQFLTNTFRIGSILTYTNPLGQLMHLMALLPFKYLYELMSCVVFGWTPNQLDPNLANLLLTQNPNAVSLKTLYHFSQGVGKGHPFKYFDHGSKTNLKLYGQEDPPNYPVEKILAPFFFISSTSDSLVTVKDQDALINRLSDQANIYGRLIVSGLNHIDISYGKDRMEKIFYPVLNFMDSLVSDS